MFWWRLTYTYDGDGRLVSLLNYYDESNQARYTCAYDQNGNTISETYDHISNGQWVVTQYDAAAFDANNNRIYYLGEFWSNGVLESGECVTSTYDANGHRLSNVTERMSNGQWTETSREVCTYDFNGNILTIVRACFAVYSERSTYTYDVQGNLSSFSFDAWLNASWIPQDWPPMMDSKTQPSPFSVSDSAGNLYNDFGRAYNFTFSHKLIVTGVASPVVGVPAVYSLSQNYPNPFNPSTTIKYELPKTSMVRLSVYDILGREVSVLVNERKNAGAYEVKCDAASLSSGVYLYRLQAGEFTQTKRMLLLR